MTRHVFSYSLYPNETSQLRLPDNAEVLGIGLSQNGSVKLFIEYDTEHSDVHFETQFTVIGTGTAWEVPEDGCYIGSVTDDGSHVQWHVYELFPAKEDWSEQRGFEDTESVVH